ncbi:hypothetical protein BV22DRAFT_994939, partial [Leucogyrophana mollusca]
DSFDDYVQGPTLEDLQDVLRNNGEGNVGSSWNYFRDYGYRILPDFAVTFNRQYPIYVEEHLLPVGEPEAQDPSFSDEEIVHHPPTDRKGVPQQVSVTDGKVAGMREMLMLAGAKNSPESVDAFVRGRTPDGDYICLRPERDATTLHTGEIRVTLDIDSIIWVTHHPHVIGSLKVHVLPYFSRKPPIAKNNHCMVEILWPQSDQDQADGVRSEWFTKSVPVSNIPHIHFAQAGDGAGSINFYVAFPHMMHKNPNTGRAATLIPSAVQMVWITQVLLPAIKAASPLEMREYSNFTLEEWKWKATVNSQLKTSRTLTLDPTTITELVHHMRSLISESPDHLNMFGSFFFIADARGIKLNTVTVRGRDMNPLVTLYTEIPTLDWDYMMKRENGQLLLDLGISYHPDPVDQEPLVGLWKLNSLHASYAKAGMNKPEEFKTCTMPRHGGLQATMESNRSRSVQLPFRSTYQLIFEAVRRPGQEEKFCADSEAYENTAEFQQTCQEFITIYQGAKQKSYGVREEIRGSGYAVREAIRCAWGKAAEYLQSDPILWIPSRVYCDFMIRRIEELRFVQVQFFKQPQPNYGIMTSIIVHLLRNVSFAVPAKHPHLTEALRDLSSEGIIQRFGMFFLHDLDPVTGELAVIAQEDSADVRFRVAPRGGKNKRSRNTTQRPVQWNAEPTAEYPLGERPTWKDLTHCLKTDPTRIVLPWKWNSLRVWDEYTSDLFVAFTKDMWLTLDPSRLRNHINTPTTLEGAMEMWSVSYAVQNLLSVHFIPNSHGLDIQANHSYDCDFANFLEVFFPEPDAVSSAAVWRSFTQANGYLHMYWDHKTTLSAERFRILKENLQKLLSYTQCLPSSTKSGPSTHGKVWTGALGTVKMRTNSNIYRLKGIGKSKRTTRKVMRLNL